MSAFEKAARMLLEVWAQNASDDDASVRYDRDSNTVIVQCHDADGEPESWHRGRHYTGMLLGSISVAGMGFLTYAASVIFVAYAFVEQAYGSSPAFGFGVAALIAIPGYVAVRTTRSVISLGEELEVEVAFSKAETRRQKQGTASEVA